MTIKKDVFETIKKDEKSLTSKEVAKKTGHNYNSVRGAIQKLRQKGKIKSVSPKEGKRPIRYKICK